MSSASLLAEVETAISAITSGAQEYTVNGRTVKRAELSELRQLRRQLRDEVNAASGRRGGFSVARFEQEG